MTSGENENIEFPSLVLQKDSATESNHNKFRTESSLVLPKKTSYETAFEKLKSMLEGRRKLNLKEAVFSVENAWHDEGVNYKKFNQQIITLAEICKRWKKSNPLKEYKFEDSTQIALSGSIFKVITDTIKNTQGKVVSLPYVYDFNDCFAQQNWENMFVTKLLATHKGNCHSLPFLYKILAEELGVKAYLAFAPQHIYLKQRSKKCGWYNTELTNATFPVDAWVMASGYVSVESIVSGIYMDTLGDKQSIAVCLNDLAKGYLRKYQKKADLNFVIKCCNLALHYYPNYAELLLLKAETIKKQYLAEKNKTEPNSTLLDSYYQTMERTYSTLVKLSYREIPDEMYYEWMKALERGKDIYSNKAAEEVFDGKEK